MLAGRAAAAGRIATQEATRRKEPVVFDNLGEAQLTRPEAMLQAAFFLMTGGGWGRRAAFGAGTDIERQVFHFSGSEPLNGDCSHDGVVSA
jgi:hypothetical protein